MKKRILFLILILAAAGAAVYAFRGSAGRAPGKRIVVSGNIELTEVNIAFKTAGRLIERTVDEGDRATKGQVIARLDRGQLLAQREREALVLAGPRIEQIKAQEGQVERARGALKMGEANTLEMKRREQELATRRAEIERSRANLALIDSQLADTIAVSPVDGVVLVKAADVGEVLAPGATVVTVGDIDHPWLRGYIDETDLGKVKLGSKANVTTDSYPGEIYQARGTL